MATKLKKLQINEVSLCDAGANQHARVTLFKRASDPFEDEPGRHGTAPKDSDPFFNAGGSGPAHDALWIAFDNYRRSMGPAQSHRAFAQAWDDLDDDGKQAIRNEEAAAEAARQAAAAAEQKEREKEVNKIMDISKIDAIVKLALQIDAGKTGNHATKFQWRSAIQAAAEADRKPHESSQQAFANYITKTEEGRAMFRCFKSATGNDYVPPAPTAMQPVIKDSARIEIAKAADELIASNPEMTRSAALAKIWADRPELAARAKKAEAA